MLTIKTVKLGQIAKVINGIRNTKTTEETKYTYNAISLKKNTYTINKIQTTKQLNKKHLLGKGDIIIKQSPPYTAKLITQENTNLTTTSNYAIIHLKDEYIPETVTFYLNSEKTKKQIHKLAEETSTQTINLKTIKNLNIIIKNKKQEEKEAETIRTYYKKKELTLKKLELEEEILYQKIYGDIP